MRLGQWTMERRGDPQPVIIAWEICTEFSDHGLDILFADLQNLHDAYSNVIEASCPHRAITQTLKTFLLEHGGLPHILPHAGTSLESDFGLRIVNRK